jgi:hypothetical protein
MPYIRLVIIINILLIMTNISAKNVGMEVFKIHMIALGFNQYDHWSKKNGKLDNLKYGQSDAKKFTQYIQQFNVKTSLYLFQDKHSKSSIIKAIETISMNANSQDVFIFYVAGKGQNGDVVLPNGERICPLELYRFTEKIQCRRQMLILDIGESQNFVYQFENQLKQKIVEKFSTDINRVVITFPLSCEMKTGGLLTSGIHSLDGQSLLGLFGHFDKNEKIIKNKLTHFHPWLSKVNIFSEKVFYLNQIKDMVDRGVVVHSLSEQMISQDIAKGETLNLIIACQNFENHNRLPNALNDALELFDIWHNQYRTKNILLVNPTYQALCDTLAYIKANYTFSQGSQFMFYIASHGVKDNYNGGFLALYDSYRINEAFYNYFPLSSLKRFATAIGATNTMVFLDLCYSETILEDAPCKPPTTMEIPINSPIFNVPFDKSSPAYKNFLNRPTHLVFGSSYDQESSDGLGNHSPFAETILHFLDEHKNALMDSYHLQQYILKKVMTLGAISEPIFCSYGGETSGRFLFIRK